MDKNIKENSNNDQLSMVDAKIVGKGKLNKEYWLKCIESAVCEIKQYKNIEYFSWIHDEEERKQEQKKCIKRVRKQIQKYKQELKKLTYRILLIL